MNTGDDDGEDLFRDSRYENVLNTIHALTSVARNSSVSPEAAIGLRVYQGLVHTYWVRRIREELTIVYNETMSNLQLRMADVAIMLGDEVGQYEDDEINALIIALRESLAEDEEEDRGENTQEAIDLVAPSPKIATEKMPRECAVCFEDIKRLQTYRELECSHYFHVRCIDPWFARKLSCPMCRHSLI